MVPHLAPVRRHGAEGRNQPLQVCANSPPTGVTVGEGIWARRNPRLQHRPAELHAANGIEAAARRPLKALRQHHGYHIAIIEMSPTGAVTRGSGSVAVSLSSTALAGTTGSTRTAQPF